MALLPAIYLMTFFSCLMGVTILPQQRGLPTSGTDETLVARALSAHGQKIECAL